MHVSAVGAREPLREIVGVVQDVKTGRLQQPAAPVVYVPHQQHPATVMSLMVRTSGDPAAAGTAVGAALHGADPTLVAQDLMTLENHVARARADQRFRAALLGVFALAAAVLAVVGLYAVVAYATGRRRHEIGVRVALGATRADVVRLVVRESLIPVAAGLTAGGLGAFLLSRWLGGLLFGVRPFEPSVVASVALALGAAAFLACYVPARRSASVDPREALRAE
jgi:predicted lysophospholipase L1 biosynthesis ABC-type transport system permease subunit